MHRIYTSRIVAMMAAEFLGWDSSVVNSVRRLVCLPVFPRKTEFPVTVLVYPSRPHPALAEFWPVRRNRAVLVYLLPEIPRLPFGEYSQLRLDGSGFICIRCG